MRRLLTGILAALILLTLAACGSEKTDAGNDGKEEDSATVNGVELYGGFPGSAY